MKTPALLVALLTNANTIELIPVPSGFSVLSAMIMSWENESVDATSLEQNYWSFHYWTYFFTIIRIILSQKLDLHPYKTILFRMFSSNGVKGKVASFFSVYQVCVLRNKRKKKIKYSNANWLEVKLNWRRELSQEYTLHFNQKRWFIHTNYNRTSTQLKHVVARLGSVYTELARDRYKWVKMSHELSQKKVRIFQIRCQNTWCVQWQT